MLTVNALAITITRHYGLGFGIYTGQHINVTPQSLEATVANFCLQRFTIWGVFNMVREPSDIAQHIFDWCRNSQPHDTALRQIALRQYVRMTVGAFHSCNNLALDVYYAMRRAGDLDDIETTARDLLEAAILFYDYTPENI